jgi:glycosyltransferase involved in cell wall biosynthesis
LPFCLVVSTYNNAKNFRYEYNLQSILNLDYNNYKVIIIDDASTDNTPQLIQKFLNSQPKQERFELIVNDVQMTAVPNIHKAITKFCS